MSQTSLLFTSARLVFACGLWFFVATPSSARGEQWLGEVSGSDVYVRSGPSLNHYVVVKLQAGARVTVKSESGEWYEIEPPRGVFSLISGDYVDTADDKTGVVNGDNVRVRCGSNVSSSKYTVQTKLSKGAEVSILQRNADGFLHISPPEGVSVWINRSFVERVPDEMVDLEAQVTAGSPVQTAPENPGDEQAEAPTSAGLAEPDKAIENPEALSALPPTAQRKKLMELDRAAKAEVAKPMWERNLQPLLNEYGKIAGQTEDAFAQRYASARVDQLNSLVSVIESASTMRRLGDKAESARREALAKRATLNVAREEPPPALDAQGELRISALYASDQGPRRFRLVDPDSPAVRTIGYVEIPVNSSIDASAFLGRYVGVRASSRSLQAGGVRPVPVYVASELVLLDRPVKTTAIRSMD